MIHEGVEDRIESHKAVQAHLIGLPQLFCRTSPLVGGTRRQPLVCVLPLFEAAEHS